MKTVYGIVTMVTMAGGPQGYAALDGCGGDDDHTPMREHLDDYADAMSTLQQRAQLHTERVDMAPNMDVVRAEESAFMADAGRWLAEMAHSVEDMGNCNHHRGQAADPSTLRRDVDAMDAALNSHMQDMANLDDIAGTHRHEDWLGARMGDMFEDGWAHHEAMMGDAGSFSCGHRGGGMRMH